MPTGPDFASTPTALYPFFVLTKNGDPESPELAFPMISPASSEINNATSPILTSSPASIVPLYPLTKTTKSPLLNPDISNG